MENKSDLNEEDILEIDVDPSESLERYEEDVNNIDISSDDFVPMNSKPNKSNSDQDIIVIDLEDCDSYNVKENNNIRYDNTNTPLNLKKNKSYVEIDLEQSDLEMPESNATGKNITADDFVPLNSKQNSTNSKKDVIVIDLESCEDLEVYQESDVNENSVKNNVNLSPKLIRNKSYLEIDLEKPDIVIDLESEPFEDLEENDSNSVKKQSTITCDNNIPLNMKTNKSVLNDNSVEINAEPSDNSKECENDVNKKNGVTDDRLIFKDTKDKTTSNEVNLNELEKKGEDNLKELERKGEDNLKELGRKSEDILKELEKKSEDNLKELETKSQDNLKELKRKSVKRNSFTEDNFCPVNSKRIKAASSNDTSEVNLESSADLEVSKTNTLKN